MPPLPALKPKQVIKMFGRLGWSVARQRGSHVILTKPGSIATLSVPNHKAVAKGTLRGLIRAAGLTETEFLAAKSKKS